MARIHLPAEVEHRVREAARNRCGYCLSPQHLVMARLEIEHIVPVSKGGTDADVYAALTYYFDHQEVVT